MQLNMLVISDKNYFVEGIERMGEVVAHTLKLQYVSYGAASREEAMEIMQDHPDISFVVCDTIPQDHFSIAESPPPDSLGPQIADQLIGLYPNLKIVGVPCCDHHGKDWMVKGRKYDLLWPGEQSFKNLTAILQETLNK